MEKLKRELAEDLLNCYYIAPYPKCFWKKKHTHSLILKWKLPFDQFFSNKIEQTPHQKIKKKKNIFPNKGDE